MKKTTVMDPMEAMKKVEEQKDRPFAGARVFEHMDLNTSHVQGDVEVVFVESIPATSELTELKDWNGVLAEGFANSGHHTVQNTAKVKAYRWTKGDQFQGPFVVADGMWTLTHPSHKWASFPAGCFEVKFPQERNLGQIRRQID
jgi:hypothetical protein